MFGMLIVGHVGSVVAMTMGCENFVPHCSHEPVRVEMYPQSVAQREIDQNAWMEQHHVRRLSLAVCPNGTSFQNWTKIGKYLRCSEDLGCFHGFGEVNRHCIETCPESV